MAIHFVSGKPGGGKTLYGVRLILKELRSSARFIVTNVPLDLPRLNEYIQQNYPEANVWLIDRIKIIGEEETQEFWKHRGPDGVGVFYVLDEIHIHFNARNWMKTGPECLHYISQHRKLCDDIICITQAVGNVDKQFRSIAQDFSVIKNEYMAKFGMFRGRGRFNRKTYEQYTGDGQKQIPFEVASFKLDAAGVASCYNTSAGVGIENKGEPDKLKRAKGLSIAWIWVTVVFVALLAGALPFGLKTLAEEKLIPKSTEKVRTVDQAKEQPSKAPLSGLFEPPKKEERFELPDPIYLASMYAIKGVYYMTLSDGRRFDTRHHRDRITLVTREFVEIDGIRFVWPVP